MQPNIEEHRRRVRGEVGRDRDDNQSCSVVRFGSCAEPTDVLSPLQIVPEGLEDGRRFYIHEGSFEDLASQSAEAAELVYSGLVAIPAVKLVHHDLSEEAVAVRGFSEANAQALEGAIGVRWFGALTQAFRCIAVRTAAGSRQQSPTPLLRADEYVVATCLDSNYYTFATTDRAAARMYADVLKLSKVRAFVRSGTDAYRDLTMVRRRRLVLTAQLADRDQTGPSASTKQKPSRATNTLVGIKQNILALFEKDLTSIIETAIAAPSALEAQVLDEFRAKCVYTVRHTILHLPK